MGHSCQNPEEIQVFTENFKLHTVFTLLKSVYAYNYALWDTSVLSNTTKRFREFFLGFFFCQKATNQ